MRKSPSRPSSTAIDGKKLELIGIPNEQSATRSSRRSTGADFTVGNVKKGVRAKDRPRRPSSPPPSSRRPAGRLGFQARRTMKVAQELYEGVEIEGIGAIGLITYMRTDSPAHLRRGRRQRQGLHHRDLRQGVPARKPAASSNPRRTPRTRHEAIRPSDPSPDARRGQEGTSPPTSISSTS